MDFMLALFYAKGIFTPMIITLALRYGLQISYLWYSAIGCILTMLVGLAVSFATGAQNPTDVDQDLLSPPIAAMFRMQTKPRVTANVQGIANFGLELEDEKQRQVDACKSPKWVPEERGAATLSRSRISRNRYR